MEKVEKTEPVEVYTPGGNNRQHLHDYVRRTASVAFDSKLFAEHQTKEDWDKVVEAARVFCKTVHEVEAELILRRAQGEESAGG